MIPHIIHYCWFGRSPLSDLAKKCIESWKKYLPEYEIKEWNEDNFDVYIIPYTAEAYKAKKYAFVSDYARFWILYKYGGLYFDTDVEIIRPMDDIIARGPFMGCENKCGNGEDNIRVAPGLGLGAIPGLCLYKEILDNYSGIHFLCKQDTIIEAKTIVYYTTEVLMKYGLRDTSEIQIVAGILIYPKDYFCPKDYVTGKLSISTNTVAIHHYGATWKSWEQRIEMKFWQLLGVKPHRFMWHLDKLIEKYFKVSR